MSRRLRPLAALAMIALISLISVGCGSNTADTGSSSGIKTTAATTARDQAVKFAACMRANGVKEFPDPDASGRRRRVGIVPTVAAQMRRSARPGRGGR